jgi:hypothetical protein
VNVAVRDRTDSTQTAARINDAARRLARTSSNGAREKKLAKRYVRNSIALDPDTTLAGKPRSH